LTPYPQHAKVHHRNSLHGEAGAKI